MKISELLEKPVEYTSRNLYLLSKHLDEQIDFDYDYDWHSLDLHQEKVGDVDIKYYKDWCYDGRRIWVLASVWYKQNLVMIIQNAGREGDDHCENFVVDIDMYNDLVSFLSSFERKNTLHIDMYDVDENIPTLTEFYGDSLDTPFKRY